MVCAVCPGLHGVTLAGRILKLRDLKLREDGHLRVTNACTTHTSSGSPVQARRGDGRTLVCIENGPSTVTPYRGLQLTVINGLSKVTSYRRLRLTVSQRSKYSDPIPDTPRHVTSPNFAPEQTSRSNAAWSMPASREPRALPRADVESAWQCMNGPRPYPAACVGLTFDCTFNAATPRPALRPARNDRRVRRRLGTRRGCASGASG